MLFHFQLLDLRICWRLWVAFETLLEAEEITYRYRNDLWTPQGPGVMFHTFLRALFESESRHFRMPQWFTQGHHQQNKKHLETICYCRFSTSGQQVSDLLIVDFHESNLSLIQNNTLTACLVPSLLCTSTHFLFHICLCSSQSGNIAGRVGRPWVHLPTQKKEVLVAPSTH